MFGTFRYDDSTNETEYVKLSRSSGVDARGYTLVACNLCRARKLKCSGDRNGCDRCQASSSECTYGPSGDNDWPGRGKGAGRQRRRQQSLPLSPSTTDNDPTPVPLQHGRPGGTSRASNGRRPAREARDAGSRDSRHQGGSDRSRDGRQTTPPTTTSAPASALPPSTNWSSDFFDFNDFTDANGEQPAFLAGLEGLSGLDTTNHPADSSLANAVFSLTPGPPPPLPQRPDLPAASVRSASISAPEDTANPDPASDASHRSSQPSLETAGAGGCVCLSDLAGILERLGRYRLSDRPKAANNLDCLLYCLGTGVSTCKKVISCTSCTACQDHSVLIATIAQQLTGVCNDLCSCLMMHQHKAKAAAAPSSSSSPPSFPGAAAAHQAGEDEALVDGEISFGRYQIHGVEMRLRLVQNLMALHMADLLALLGQLWQRMGHVRGASGMLAEAQKRAQTADWMLQRLRSE